MTDQLWQRRDTWVGTQVEDQLVMINIDAGDYVALNSSATAVWNALEQPVSVGDIVGSLRARFDVPEDICRQAVERVLGELKSMKLVDPL